MTPMPFEQLEAVYEELAAAIDGAGAEREALLLTKLCMLLAHRLGDLQTVRECLAIALADGADVPLPRADA
jgi:hypothetical protein